MFPMGFAVLPLGTAKPIDSAETNGRLSPGRGSTRQAPW